MTGYNALFSMKSVDFICYIVEKICIDKVWLFYFCIVNFKSNVLIGWSRS